MFDLPAIPAKAKLYRHAAMSALVAWCAVAPALVPVAQAQGGNEAVSAGLDVATCRSLQVYDPVTGIYDPAALRDEVTVEGVVYVAPGTYSAGGGGYLQDDSGGINFWRWPAPLSIHVGDRIRITGPVWPDAGMLYIGTFTYVKLDSLLTPMPTAYSLAALLGDFSNTGSHVSVAGRIADVTTDSFRLEDGASRIEVRRSAFAGVDFSGLVAGRTCTVVSPCLMEEGTLYLKPAGQAAITVQRQHYVATDGDDAGLGTKERPYRTIQRGIDAAINGDVVLIEDGTYTGPGNRDIDFGGKIIRVRSASGHREACVVDAQGSTGEPHVGFKFTGGETLETVLQDITVTGGYPAGITCGTLSVWSVSAPTVRNVVLERNAGVGMSVQYVSANGGSSSIRIVSALVRDNAGGGLRFERFGGASIDSCEVNGNEGGGIYLLQTDRPVIIGDSRVVNNTGDGLFFWNSGHGLRTTARRCLFSGNYGWGATGDDEDISLEFYDSIIESNGSGGIRMTDSIYSSSLLLVGSDVRNNGGPGIGACLDIFLLSIVDCRVVGNAGNGIDNTHYPAEFPSFPKCGPSRAFVGNITDCVVDGNDGTGISMDAPFGFTIAQTVVTHNRQGGIYLGSSHRGEYQLCSLTIADNLGDGFIYGAGDPKCVIANSVVADNAGLSITTFQTDQVSISCSDFRGNQGGDWIGQLSSYLATNGNLSVAPLFCDPLQGDYHLRHDSPLSADNSGGCGTIGALEWACPGSPGAPFVPHLRDVPADQGGQLRVSWLRNPSDASGAATPVTSYEIQRFGAGWQPVATLAAAAADSYVTVVSTPDIQTIGQPVPYSRYRLVARTANPAVFFESVVDSACSIDNLAPPKPAAVIVDGPSYRYVVWPSPGVPDLATACVYRGTQPGFTPDTPVGCPNDFYNELNLGWYFYRVQFADTHGNLSEFSDELHGRWPTPVPNAVPGALRLCPCQPNPFNPRTTLRFDLPEAGHVRLTIFDIAGRLVRTLVDESLAQGSHEAAWDGRNATGREVGSGSYLARLEFEGKVEAVRMGLVR